MRCEMIRLPEKDGIHIPEDTLALYTIQARLAVQAIALEMANDRPPQ